MIDMKTIVNQMLLELFQQNSLEVFEYENNSNLIEMRSEFKCNCEIDTKIFEEMQLITTKLHELNCEYSISDCFDIILYFREK